MKLILFGLVFLTACSNPLEGPGKLNFRDLKQEELLKETERLEAQNRRESERKKFQAEKKRFKEEIYTEALQGLEEIRPLLKTKCFDCHDSGTKLPLYGRILPKINPVHKHQREGLEALDFVKGFPLLAKGNPPQLALLKSIKISVEDSTMPLKSYTRIYPSRKLTTEDQDKILAWVDPIIARLTEYEDKYEFPGTDEVEIAQKVLELKCFRCHANGNARGGFGDMENPEKLLKSKFINRKDPTASILYTISESGQMPPRNKNTLTQKELFALQEWLINLSKK